MVKLNLPRATAWTLGLLLFAAVFRDLLANGKPLYCQVGKEHFFPGLRDIFVPAGRPHGHRLLDSLQRNQLWKTYHYNTAIFALIPFSPGEWSRNLPCDLKPPGTLHPGLGARFRHWLGTDRRGRDVAAGLVSGARIALLTGTLAMSLAFGLGVCLGAIAGFFGDKGLAIRWGRFRLALPVDLALMRIAEVFEAVPTLLLIVTVAAMLPNQSLWWMIALIGVKSWPNVSLLVRAELLRIRSLDYITAARGLGFSETRLLWRHALPNAMRPAYVALALGMASAILLESSLTFLGFGGDVFKGVSWGSLLQSAREDPSAWWVTLPPALALASATLALHAWGEGVDEGV